MEVQYRALSMVLLAPFWPHLSNFGLVSGQIGYVWETLLHFLISQRGQGGSVSAVNQFYIKPNYMIEHAESFNTEINWSLGH